MLSRPTRRALLAAAILRDALGAIIDAPPKPASTEQLEYVDDLSAWSTPADPQASTHAIASALLTMLETRRALEWLEALQLRAGRRRRGVAAVRPAQRRP